MMDEKIVSSFPNVFYDLIVFVAPSVLLLTGVVTGLTGWPFITPEGSKINLGAADVFLISVGLLFLGYEYGRMAEALSAVLVSKIIRVFHTHSWAFKNSDFQYLLTNEVDCLELTGLAESRKGSKWTILFFASLVTPDIGRDLLKRYAWEKLARSSAMTLGLLLLCSGIFVVLRIIGWSPAIVGTWGFGSLPYTITVAILVLATYYEYYQRNCWNNDLLCKTLPVLLFAAKWKIKVPASATREDSESDSSE